MLAAGTAWIMLHVVNGETPHWLHVGLLPHGCILCLYTQVVPHVEIKGEGGLFLYEDVALGA